VLNARKIAVAVGHGEEVRPDHDAYRELFATLEAEGATIAMVETLDDDALAAYGALVIGAPARPLDDAELAATRRWLTAGGVVLAIPPNLEALVPELAVGPDRVEATYVELPFKIGDSFSIAIDGWAVRAREATLSWAVQGSGLRGADGTPATGCYLAVRIAIGRGHAVVLCSPQLIGATLPEDDDYGVWTDAVIRHWLSPIFTDELARRMRGPQRHRLLQAYPMAPAMFVSSSPGIDTMLTNSHLRPAYTRAAVVGVLPHPYCNPAVRGCGFCTFPHETYARDRAELVGAQVVRELQAFRTRLVTRKRPEPWPRRPVEALYLGGGTANLTPPETFRAIGAALDETFVLDDAEVTFEGVPIYFTARRPSPLDLLREAFPRSRWRVSLGIQTFDPVQLARMGRTHFGDREAFARVVTEARARGFTTSADLLFDLPGQTLPQILDDARAAVDLGLDQICFYHLVMFDGLETEWSRDRSLLAMLPDNPRAEANWLALREELLAAGYVQTSLTDFERRDAYDDERRRFRYEPCVFAPERCDQLGFGPSAVTFWGTGEAITWKLVNPTTSEHYLRASPTKPWEREFAYGTRDWAILYLTRKIAALGVDRVEYARLFEADPLDDLGEAFAALAAARLVAITPARIEVTPRGMFYADAIAGLLAWRRMQTFRIQDRRLGGSVPLRERDLANEAGFAWMG
jgi:oxygen-independent coproporphyrinogen-3 oxidase